MTSGRSMYFRVFGEDLNLVLFDLKTGFKFHDQLSKRTITWVIKGEMDFYVKNLKKLNPGLGVDIASFDTHGGVSNQALVLTPFTQ